MNKVSTTRIVKKYQDKKTGQWKEITIDYAKVGDRLKAFREANPRSKIATEHTRSDDGETVFKAWGWKDKSDFLDILRVNANKDVAYMSADANGTAKNVIKNEKDFEKLETIAVGRMLALLGYGVGGEVATSEEMEEFENYQTKKHEQAILSASKTLQDAKTIKDLAKAWNTLPATLKAELTAVKDDCKTKLVKGAKDENN